MKVCYTAIYKLHGANSLPDEAESEHLLALQTPAFTARLTTNPEPYFLHVDKSAALGTQLLKGMFAPDKAGTLQQRLTAEIEEIKAHRSKGAGGGVYLVFEGEADIPTPEFRARRDTDEFAVSLDDIDKSDIRERFRPAMQSVLGALGLSLPVTPTVASKESGMWSTLSILMTENRSTPSSSQEVRSGLRPPAR